MASIGTRFTEANSVDVLCNGQEIFPPMLDAIRSAEKSIDFVTFVFWTGPIATEFLEAFQEKARQGVRVRALFDGFGTLPMRDGVVDDLREAGVDVAIFRRLRRWKFWESDHRTHRKILICDDQVAFTGGVGIASEWEGDGQHRHQWRDTHFRVRGPAVVDLRAAFFTDWRDARRPLRAQDLDLEPVLPAGDIEVSVVDGSAQIGYNEIQRVLEALIVVARERIWIQTPYFNPTDTVLDRLLEAHERGVDVQLLIPGPHIDKELSRLVALDRMRPLVESGMKAWSYQPSMMHVKAVLVDGALSFVGSTNVNRRSVHKDEEVAMAIFDRGVTSILEAHFENDRDHSERITSVELPLWARVATSAIWPARREF